MEVWQNRSSKLLYIIARFSPAHFKVQFFDGQFVHEPLSDASNQSDLFFSVASFALLVRNLPL